MMYTRFVQSSALLLFLLFAGCGDNLGLVKVAGVVTCDGKPVPASGTITFMPVMGSDMNNVQRGVAQFGADGKFAASTYSQGDGLLPGKYTVRIECWETPPSLKGGGGVSLIDRKYADYSRTSVIPELEVFAKKPQTALTFDVVAASNEAVTAERTAHKTAETKAPKTGME